MPKYTNPIIVWQRITLDVQRLSDAVKRNGSPEMQQAFAQAIDALNTLTPYFDRPTFSVEPQATKLAVADVGSKSKDDIKHAPRGFIAYKRGEEFDDNQTSEWKEAWLKAYYQANPKENTE